MLTTCDILSDNFKTIAKFGRQKGPNKRRVSVKEEIRIHSIHGGDIVGYHIILHIGRDERIELKHQIHSREYFVTGSIKAIKFIVAAKENKIYSTNEVLGL